MKKPIILLSICMVFSVTLVVALYALSDHSIRKHNSFLRVALKNPIHNIGALNLDYNSYYIAGVSDDKIYFGNVTGVLHMLVTNILLTDTQHVTLAIRNVEKLKFSSPKVKVAPPFFYIVDGVIPSLYRGEITKWQADSFMYDKAAYFIDAVPFDHSSMAIRTTSKLTDELVLGKIVADTPYVELAPGLLQKQIDGKFCTDGMLHYDKASANLIYLYYYRNQYIVMDTSLNLIYRGNTIDTVSRAQIKTARKTLTGPYTMAAPPLIVNENSCVSNGLLFVNSTLLARNEVEETFNKLSVIDVYNLKEGTYKYSFYVPKYNGEHLREFRVIDNKLIVLYDQRVETYELNDEYFPKQGNKKIAGE